MSADDGLAGWSGRIEKYLGFEGTLRDMCKRIDRLPPIKNKYIQQYWADGLQLELPRELRAAVGRLLERSRWNRDQIKRAV